MDKSRILYHGSNVIVDVPVIREGLRALDFGRGFYLTSSRSQAEKWAKAVFRRRKSGDPHLNIYKFYVREDLEILQFGTANADWLDFVAANRKEQIMELDYDLIIGPVANDSTLPVIDDYMDGKYTKAEAIERLMPQNLTDQYAFLTEKALRCLDFQEATSL